MRKPSGLLYTLNPCQIEFDAFFLLVNGPHNSNQYNKSEGNSDVKDHTYNKLRIYMYRKDEENNAQISSRRKRSANIEQK
jgi:hypothetical protein